MGTVYLAEHNDRTNVSIKLVRPGMDTEIILHRFRRERQILAQLDHPHIARLLDGGSANDGRPYIVMEYIDGVPITHHANKHALGIRERLRLFLDLLRGGVRASALPRTSRYQAGQYPGRRQRHGQAPRFRNLQAAADGVARVRYGVRHAAHVDALLWEPGTGAGRSCDGRVRRLLARRSPVRTGDRRQAPSDREADATGGRRGRRRGRRWAPQSR